VAEATDLSTISDNSYDFLLACHVLEHIANPLKAMEEWKRVLSPGGVLLVIVPDKRGTFDRRRPFTSFEHIESDFRANVSEDDPTHANEILKLHDLGLDPGAGSPEDFRARCFNNRSVRGMHHHVFSPELLILMFDRIQMRLLNVVIERPEHIIVFAQRVTKESADPAIVEYNRLFLKEDADWRLYDPLPRGAA
jgi:SAM-dependent methyltransferase